MSDNLLEAPERVLSTMNPDGSRRWIRPKSAMGKWWKRRRVVAWLLMILFTAVPWMSINGKPVMLLDVVHRDFIFFGVTFQPTEVVLLMLLMLGIFISIFLITSLLGRGWCGWACPQTVYLEFLYRPIERLVEGKGTGKAHTKVAKWRVALKYALYLVFSLHLANTFLAYFAGPQQVLEWSFGAPQEHMTAFLIVMLVTAMIMYDFSSFREQMCTLACPYARLQSVLLDRDSLIVGYDEERGEPRGKKKAKDRGENIGDCIDCGLCVAACPTGIDIREGLQLECIACTQCIDACDTVMDKIKRPTGLIRFASQNTLAGIKHKMMRPRVIIYPLVLIGIFAHFIVGLNNREMGEAMFLRNQSAVAVPTPDGVVQTVIVRVDNRDDIPHTYSIESVEGVEILGAQFPFELEAYGSRTINLPVRVAASVFENSRYTLEMRVFDDVEFTANLHTTLFAPAVANE
ncbi:MAG: cytochrome c oxidase accessory protein CcoG [Planctomycetes bacterium]|nr:cytochrome c oxidase accessory protein CcoG [Planctomycetota bacterium]MCP4770477.1 cytochrome c oxidase accessory protein CcoG [Planctomycetota bacterium]MCP4859917.1 cytochrome c oxidase accessory protein CcoG [Planctomycetota bacterium]